MALPWHLLDKIDRVVLFLNTYLILISLNNCEFSTIDTEVMCLRKGKLLSGLLSPPDWLPVDRTRCHATLIVPDV